MGSRKDGAGAGAGQEQEDEGARAGGLEIAKTVGVVGAGLALLGWGISKLVSASSAPAEAEVFGEKDDKKKMKRPGKPNEIIYREDFQRNPSTYFRDLRNKD